MAFSKTRRFLSKAEILGVGVFPPLPRLRESPRTIAIVNEHLDEYLEVNFGMVIVLLLLQPAAPSTIATMNSASRCSSRCPRRCTIRYGDRAWTSPLFFQSL